MSVNCISSKWIAFKMLLFFFIVISSILFVKLNEPVDKVYIVVDENLTRNISSLDWCEMSSKNSYDYINLKHQSNPIISFKIKTEPYSNNKINICYSNILLFFLFIYFIYYNFNVLLIFIIIATASIVIFLGILYAFVLMLNNRYDNWYRCCITV